MPADINQVKMSYGRCLMASNKEKPFFDRFYELFLASDPAIKEKFAGTDFERQTEALQYGISMAIMYAERNDRNAENILNNIRQSHGPTGRDIRPEHYGHWIECLLQTVKEYDQKCDTDTLENWRQLAQGTVDYLLR